MFKEINVLKAAEIAARYAVERQALIAENVANADTPDYKTRDLEPFGDAFQKANPDNPEFETITVRNNSAEKPNGNNVSIEEQMFWSANATRIHSTAMAVYSKSIDMLRASLGRR